MKNLRFHLLAFALGISLGLAGTAFGATTISTNISTGGTLTVRGASYLTGGLGIASHRAHHSDYFP